MLAFVDDVLKSRMSGGYRGNLDERKIDVCGFNCRRE